MGRRLLYLFISALILSLVFLLWPSAAQWSFILKHRSQQLLTILLLSISGGVSTIVFQTVTANRLLTPSLMGIDNLYLLIQALFVAVLGGQSFIQLFPLLKFSIQLSVMIIVATTLFTFLLIKLKGDIIRLLLIGIVFSLFCRSVTEFISRLLDPTEYAVYQSAAYAQITQVNASLLTASFLIILLILGVIWWKSFILDIISLGKNTAISLGVNYLSYLMLFIVLIVLLVSISTALVGPMLFFGLVASAISYRLFPTIEHRYLIPAAILIAFLALLGGQIIFEKLLHLGGTLSVAVECLGGITFLALIFKENRPNQHKKLKESHT